ncbi:type VI secretion system baseplate subunit TssG [Citrobacter sedlakii]|nr:type VI secretion system baseplate subunit TssG [Citrobacter sedlakii]
MKRPGYHIWRKYNWHISFRNGGADIISQRMFALIGLGNPRVRERLDICHCKLLPYAGTLAGPGRSPRFDPKCSELCHYCLALTQVLTGQGLLPETRNYLGCLLYDLIHYFSDEITAPRWLRTADGVKFIDGVAA